jgi:F0F1-type ATP synthase membrane subunit b/b'
MKKTSFFKKSLATLFCTVILVVSFSAAACAPSNKAQQIMDNANTKISACVEKSQNQANKLLDKGYSSSNEKILDICKDLQQDTLKIEQQAEQKLETMGVSFTCEYYHVDIAGNQLLIDPFKSM